MISDMNWIKRMLSHNVRMPMSIITGYGELLRQGLLSPEEQQGIISNICDNINYMNDVLKVVLDEAEDGQTAEKVDLAQIIERTASFVQEVARKIPVTISVRTERPQMYVEANSVAVMRVLYHLFENALKYLPPYGNISINAYYAGEKNILVVFKDDGRGIDEKEVKNLFEKGYRGQNSSGKGGSGYGLYEVKQLMEQNGGTVEVSSREGGGFSIYLMFSVYPEGKEVKADGTDFIG